MKDLYILYINPFQYGVCHLGWLLCIGAIHMNHMNPFAARLFDAQKNDGVSVSYPWAKSWKKWLEFAFLKGGFMLGCIFYYFFRRGDLNLKLHLPLLLGDNPFAPRQSQQSHWNRDSPRCHHRSVACPLMLCGIFGLMWTCKLLLNKLKAKNAWRYCLPTAVSHMHLGLVDVAVIPPNR